MQPFDTFTLSYSNGQQDADDEQANPQLYSWWSDTHGATNGASDNHAVRFSGFTFCVAESPEVDMKLSKSVDKSNVKPGETVIYTLTATNTSTTKATGVTVTDKLPAGLTFVSHNGADGAYDANTGVWNIGTVEPGTAVSLQITAKVD